MRSCRLPKMHRYKSLIHRILTGHWLGWTENMDLRLQTTLSCPARRLLCRHDHASQPPSTTHLHFPAPTLPVQSSLPPLLLRV